MSLTYFDLVEHLVRVDLMPIKLGSTSVALKLGTQSVTVRLGAALVSGATVPGAPQNVLAPAADSAVSWDAPASDGGLRQHAGRLLCHAVCRTRDLQRYDLRHDRDAEGLMHHTAAQEGRP